MHSYVPRAAYRRSSAPASRVLGLTGLRALAVLAVLGYHLLPDVVPGGFVGVDVFFVVSGFIVTRMLLVEHAGARRIALGSFWVRRARRILPALVVMLAVCVPLAFTIDARLLEGIRRQLIGAATFSSNWLAIAADGDYFHAEQPELFTNLWSLALEEQFYLLAPVLLILALTVFRVRAHRLAGTVLVLAALSAVAMAVLSGVPFGSPTRAYFGTDTHAFGLLIGAALALALGPSAISSVKARRNVVARTTVGVGALIVLVVLAATMSSAGWFPAHGGLLLASMAAAGLIWSAATTPTLGRVLDARPLRWLGERSYAVYLWHWPLLLILGATPIGALPLVLVSGAAALSIAAAALSFAFVEAPFRRGSSAIRRPDRLPRDTRRRRAPSTAIAGLLVGALALGSIFIAVAHDEAPTDAEQLVARGRTALENAADEDVRPAPAGSSSPSPGDRTAVPATSAPTSAPAPTMPPSLAGTDVTAIGDSVMLAAAPELQAKLPGITIDAEVSRSMWVAPGILSDLASSGALRSVVVLGLATNGEIGPDLLGQVLDIVGAERTLVLITGHADRAWIPRTNATLADFAAAHTNVVVADWDGMIASHPEDLAHDGIHPQPHGSVVYAEAIPGAVDAARAEVVEAEAG